MMDREQTGVETMRQLASCTVALTLTLAVSVSAQVLRTVEDEVVAGDEAARQVEQQMGLYRAETTEEYVREIGERLVSGLGPSPYTFTFQVVDQSVPNAFALPGGHIYVSRGLVMLANSEDEIAGVLGHEISHVTQRHSARQSRRAILPTLLAVPGAVVGGVVSEDLGTLMNAPIMAVGKVSLSRYGRGQEREADELGMALAARSGYEPRALAVILTQLERDVAALTGETRKASFFDSHPTTPKRVQGIDKGAAKIQRNPQPALAADQADFLGRLDGLHSGDNPAQGLFRDQQFLHPDLNFTITFPDSWKTVNNPSVVGAVAPGKEALAALGVVGEAEDPTELGRAFVAKLAEKYRTTPTEARAVEVGKWPGYLVTLTEGSGRSAANLHYLWVTIGDVTFQLIAAGPETARPTLREIALSLRPLTPQERASITAKRLRIVTADDDETLATLGPRAANVWSESYTALVNNLPAGKPLDDGLLIKIAREEAH